MLFLLGLYFLVSTDSTQSESKVQRTPAEYSVGRVVVLSGLPECATIKGIRVRCR